MSEQWYYVQDGERVGPIEKTELMGLISTGKLSAQDFVWKKGLEGWVHIEKLDELRPSAPSSVPESLDEIPGVIEESRELSSIGEDEKVIFVKIGQDRGGREVEYGPFNLGTIRKLYNENRINGKTLIYTKYFKEWLLLADFSDFEEVFNELPPAISDEDRRAFRRMPFIARMFFANDEKVFEGICRDISIGGMQVLVDHFPCGVGERISINVHPENSEHHFVAEGEIVRKLEADHGFSFRFIDLSNDAVVSIQKYISGQ